MNEFSKEIEYLKSIGCDKLPHSNRTLLEHLIGTTQLLKNLGRSEIEQKAGLFHSIYGTEYYRDSEKLKIKREEIINDLLLLFCLTLLLKHGIINNQNLIVDLQNM